MDQKKREGRDETVQKYGPKIAVLQERIRKAQQSVEIQAAQANQQNMQTALSIGTTLLGAFMGRRTVGSSYSRAGPAISGVGRSMKERKDVEGAKDTVENLNQQLTTLDSEFKNEVLNLDAKSSQKDLETVTIKPGKANISVKLVSLVWMPN